MTSITDWAKKYAIKPAGVVHVGACVGEERGEWAEITKRVLWIEANPALIEELKRNVEPLGHEVVHAVAGASSGKAIFHVSPHVACSSVLPLGRHAVHYPHIGYEKDVAVPMLTLDEILCGRDADFDYLYMDTQGYEGDVLMGATRYLHSVKWIYTEYNGEEMYTGCWLMPRLSEHLKACGLHLAEIEPLHPAWGNALFIRR